MILEATNWPSATADIVFCLCVAAVLIVACLRG